MTRFGIAKPQQSDVGQFHLAAVGDDDRNHVVPATGYSQRAFKVIVLKIADQKNDAATVGGAAEMVQDDADVSATPDWLTPSIVSMVAPSIVSLGHSKAVRG